jgi:hypothetical protein
LSLSEEFSSFLPLSSIAQVFSLLHENDWITLVTMFLNQVICLLELLQGSVQIDGLVNEGVFHKMSSCLFVLSLVSQDFSDEPLFIKCPHLIHLVSEVAKIDKFEVAYTYESFPCEREVFSEQRLNTEGTPVLLSDTDACNLIGHCEVFLLEEPIEGGRLRHIDRVHSAALQAEDL